MTRLQRRYIKPTPPSPPPSPIWPVRRPARPPDPRITPEETRNGWTLVNLEAYRREREMASDLVGGFVVTPITAPRKMPTRIEAAFSRNPHAWGR